MKAWLVTWEWGGEHARVEDPIAAIINSRTSPERVRELVEFIYVHSWFSFKERLAYAKNKKGNICPATFNSIEGVPFTGQITCGFNPFLYARLVEGIHIKDDGSPEGKLEWRESSQQEVKRIAAAIRKLKGISTSDDYTKPQ